MFQSLIHETHRPAESLNDVVLNDIDNPLTQEDIRQIIDLKFIDEFYGDLSHHIVLKEDNYFNNKTKEGMFYQVYKVEYESINVTYKLNIYNINFNEDTSLNDGINISLNVDLGSKYNKENIISKILNETNLMIHDYEIVETNYLNNDVEGEYFINIVFRTINNEKVNVVTYIRVQKNQKDDILKLISLIIISILIVGTIIYKLYNKRRMYNV